MDNFEVENTPENKEEKKNISAKSKPKTNKKKVKKNTKRKPVSSVKRAKRTKNIRNMSMYIFGMVIKVIVYAAVIFFVYFACSKAYDFGTKLFVEEGIAEKDSVKDVEVVVTIPTGSSSREVAAILKKNGLIEDELVFYIQSILYEGEFKSGTYTLRTSYEPEVLVDALSGRKIDLS